jgi:hypothetical protein
MVPRDEFILAAIPIPLRDGKADADANPEGRIKVGKAARRWR